MNKTKAQAEVERLNKQYGTKIELVPQEEINIRSNYKIEQHRYQLERDKFNFEVIKFAIAMGFAIVSLVFVFFIYVSTMEMM